MTLINNIDNQIFNGSPPIKEITMNDIAKCRGPGNFFTRFIGQVQTFIRTRGKYVNDETVVAFMQDHFKDLESISTLFKEAVKTPEDQDVVRKLTKVFANASKHVQGEGINPLQDGKPPIEMFQQTMLETYSKLKALKTLDSYDPEDLLRATLLKPELLGQRDVKLQFLQFIREKNKTINTKDDLKNAYDDFKKELISGNDVKSIPKDHSLDHYIRAENDLFHWMSDVHKVPIDKLLSEIQKKEKSELIAILQKMDTKKIDQMQLKGLMENPKIYSFLKEMASQANSLKQFEYLAQSWGIYHVVDSIKVKDDETGYDIIDLGSPDDFQKKNETMNELINKLLTQEKVIEEWKAGLI